MLSLQPEGGVVARVDNLKDALRPLLVVPSPAGLGYVDHALPQVAVGIGKELRDDLDVGRSSGYVVGRVVRVDDGQPIGIFVREACDAVLEDGEQ